MKKLFEENQEIRWGIIGVGDVTEIKSGPAFQKNENNSIVAVMRRDKEKLEDYAKRHNIPRFYTDASELINDKEVDAVYIATPPDSHRYYALKVAETGKPCCVEKPMAPNYEESKIIFEAFAEKDLPLFVAYYRRTLPRFAQVKKWLDENEIGAVRHVTWLYSRPPLDADRAKQYSWRTDSKIAPGGYFDDLASHGLDLFCHFFGRVETASGSAVNQQAMYDSFDSAAGAWRYESGVTGCGLWNFGTEHFQDWVQILGENGSIHFSIFKGSDFVLENENGRVVKNIPNPENVQLYHVEAMSKHLRGQAEHPSLGEQGAHTSWVMDKILGN